MAPADPLALVVDAVLERGVAAEVWVIEEWGAATVTSLDSPPVLPVALDPLFAGVDLDQEQLTDRLAVSSPHRVRLEQQLVAGRLVLRRLRRPPGQGIQAGIGDRVDLLFSGTRA